MRLIDTSYVAPGIQYPGLANVGGQSVGNSPIHAPGIPSQMQGLDFLQQALLDMVDALCRALIVDPSKPTVIANYPIPSPPIAGFAQPQYIYYQGEVFYVPGYSIVAISGPGAFVATLESNPTDNGSPAPQTMMSDGSQISIHNQRTITVAWSPSGLGGNFPPPSQWLYPENNFQFFAPTINVVGTGSGLQDYHSGWAVNNRLAYYIIGNEVTIQGDVAYTSGSGVIFYLPSNMRPKYDLYIPIYTSAGGGAILNISAASGGLLYTGTETSGMTININAKFTIL